MRGRYRSVICIILTACASRQAVPNEDAPIEKAYRSPEVILRRTSWEDAELAAKGLGRLEFVVHVADRPAQAVDGAVIEAKLAGAASAGRQVSTDGRGVAQLDSMAVGRYELTIRRIGYVIVKSEVTVSPGCRTDVEVYLGILAMGIAPPPPEPARVRVTTCRVGR